MSKELIERLEAQSREFGLCNWSDQNAKHAQVFRKLFDDAAARIAELESIVSRRTKTADGAVVDRPGMMLYSSNEQYADIVFVTTAWHEWDGLNGVMSHGWNVYPADPDGRPIRLSYSEDIDCLYSTRAAAEAARTQEQEKTR